MVEPSGGCGKELRTGGGGGVGLVTKRRGPLALEPHMGNQGRTRRGRGSWALGWVLFADRPREPSKKGPGHPGIPGGPERSGFDTEG